MKFGSEEDMLLTSTPQPVWWSFVLSVATTDEDSFYECFGEHQFAVAACEKHILQSHCLSRCSPWRSLINLETSGISIWCLTETNQLHCKPRDVVIVAKKVWSDVTRTPPDCSMKSSYRWMAYSSKDAKSSFSFFEPRAHLEEFVIETSSLSYCPWGQCRHESHLTDKRQDI